MKEITLKGTFYEMGKQYGEACKKNIKSFAKMAYLMASLAKKPGSQPFNPNLWYPIPTLFTYKKEKPKWQALAKEYEKEIKLQKDLIAPCGMNCGICRRHFFLSNNTSPLYKILTMR